jgi:hypothetical protein
MRTSGMGTSLGNKSVAGGRQRPTSPPGRASAGALTPASVTRVPARPRPAATGCKAPAPGVRGPRRYRRRRGRGGMRQGASGCGKKGSRQVAYPQPLRMGPTRTCEFTTSPPRPFLAACSPPGRPGGPGRRAVLVHGLKWGVPSGKPHAKLIYSLRLQPPTAFPAGEKRRVHLPRPARPPCTASPARLRSLRARRTPHQLRPKVAVPVMGVWSGNDLARAGEQLARSEIDVTASWPYEPPGTGPATT